MSEENNKSNDDLSLEEIKEELDKVKKRNRLERFLKNIEDAGSYRASLQDEQEQCQEDNDELDRTDTCNPQKTNQENHSLWSCLLSFLRTIVRWGAICILFPFVFLILFLLHPVSAFKDLISYINRDVTTYCYYVNRNIDNRYRHPIYWGCLLGILCIIGGLIFLIYSLIKYYLF